jgi:predicted acylesterase/phospholipase RssA
LAIRGFEGARGFGIKFDAVSGTSVGALNGALWCAGAMDIGDDLWRSMSREKIFSLRKWLLPVAIVGLVLRLFYAFAFGLTSERNSEYSSLALAFCCVLSFPLLAIPVSMIDSRGWIVSTIIAAFSVPVMLLPLFVFYTLGIDRRATNASLVIFALFIGWCYALLNTITGTAPDTLLRVKWILLATGTIPFVILFIALLLEVHNVSVFDAAPINYLAQKVLSRGLQCTLFATTARVASFFDPDHFWYLQWTSHGVTVPTRPVAQTEFVPLYCHVNSLNVADACEVLMASTALPLGILKWRPDLKDLKGDMFIDGGVVDNLPWFPLINHGQYDELVFVYCSPISKWNRTKAVIEWSKKDRFLRVIEANFRPPDFPPNWHRDEKREFVNQPPNVIPQRDPPSWPQVVIQIGPPKSLGTFFTGTLGFSRCSQWVAEGYETGAIAARTISTRREE